jgi:hypothetical protein
MFKRWFGMKVLFAFIAFAGLAQAQTATYYADDLTNNAKTIMVTPGYYTLLEFYQEVDGIHSGRAGLLKAEVPEGNGSKVLVSALANSGSTDLLVDIGSRTLLFRVQVTQGNSPRRYTIALEKPAQQAKPTPQTKPTKPVTNPIAEPTSVKTANPPATTAQPVSQWKNWSWDTNVTGALVGSANALDLTYKRDYAGLYLHQDAGVTGFDTIHIKMDRAVKLNIWCLESHDGANRENHPNFVFETRANETISIPLSKCNGGKIPSALHEVMLILDQGSPNKAARLLSLELSGSNGRTSMLANVQNVAYGQASALAPVASPAVSSATTSTPSVTAVTAPKQAKATTAPAAATKPGTPSTSTVAPKVAERNPTWLEFTFVRAEMEPNQVVMYFSLKNSGPAKVLIDPSKLYATQNGNRLESKMASDTTVGLLKSGSTRLIKVVINKPKQGAVYVNWSVFGQDLQEYSLSRRINVTDNQIVSGG